MRVEPMPMMKALAKLQNFSPKLALKGRCPYCTRTDIKDCGFDKHYDANVWLCHYCEKQWLTKREK